MKENLINSSRAVLFPETSNKYIIKLVRARVIELVSKDYILTVEQMRELTALQNYLTN